MAGKAHYVDVFIDEPMQPHIILFRQAGTVATNVPHLVTHHSPSGYEWGYNGSGPADLALNIAENMLRSIGFQGSLMKEPCWDGYRPFKMAWALHQGLKSHFLAGIPESVARYNLDYEAVLAWMQVAMLSFPEHVGTPLSDAGDEDV